ncbi:MAG: hypothetical protein RBQ88_05870 [Desulfobulbus oligotrophicus]|jgi:hypothetical protein|nr:hypothetical protein [Desulfobulbus oligotrophicus]
MDDNRMTNCTTFLQTRQKTLVALGWTLLVLIAGASLVVDSGSAHSWTEQHVPFFWSLFGFIAAVVIIGIARWLGRSGIQAPTDIYDRSLTPICEEEE